MKKVETKDKSVTYHSDKYDETYHSISGAKEEAVKKFVEPCKIYEIAKGGSIKILDICFGLGYNSAAAIETALESNPKCKITIIALENDEEILKEISTLDAPFKNYDIIKEVANYHVYSKDNVDVTLLVGDARETILNVNDEFDVVFLDPFSPKKCPELWTAEFFKDIFEVMKASAVMATYSCARVVRDNFKDAGFIVKDGPVVGRKAPGTLAFK